MNGFFMGRLVDNMWKGADGLLLTEYFENKKELSESKSGRNFLCYKGNDTSEIDKEIEKIEISIMEFISGLDEPHLKSIIYMSLDMDVELGLPDKLQINN